MKNSKTNIVLIGIGNSGRADDGLGWKFLEKTEANLPQNWQVEYRYQLQVEDAELISHFERVYFVDADHRKHSERFLLSEVVPKQENSFTSHELTPATVLHLCQQIYNTSPEAFLLGITGTEFALETGLSDTAVENLNKAIAFFESEVQSVVKSTAIFEAIPS